MLFGLGKANVDPHLDQHFDHRWRDPRLITVSGFDGE